MRILTWLAGMAAMLLAPCGCALPRQASDKLEAAAVEKDSPQEKDSGDPAAERAEETLSKEVEDASSKVKPPQTSSLPNSLKTHEPESLPPQAAAAVQSRPAENSQHPVDPQAMAAVMGQLAELRALDPQAHRQLMSDMKHVDPKLWPMLVQGLRASLEYRQRSPAVAAAVPPAAPAAALTPSAAPVLAGAPSSAATSSPPAGTIKPVSHETARIPADWRQPLDATIRSLEAAVAESPGPADDNRQVSLRMLYLLAGERDKALQPLTGHDALAQEFWSRELYALSTYLDTQRISDRSRRAAEAALHHWEASHRLSQQGNLLVRNLAFCTEVMSYGVYTPFERLEFPPGQPIVLYAEVENFVTQSTPRGHHAALKSSYQIFDSRGQKVEDHEFPLMEEHCHNARRDFFIAYEAVRLPAQMYDGKYTLKLTIEDTLGHKIGQSSLDFQIKQKAK